MFFDVGSKNTVNYSVFGHLTLKNHGICSGFCFSPRKNTVNNSNFAVFSCFSLFFELRWSAIHGYQILRVFFPTISTFGCFWSQWPTSLAVTMRCGRLPSRSDVNNSCKIIGDTQKRNTRKWHPKIMWNKHWNIWLALWWNDDVLNKRSFREREYPPAGINKYNIVCI